jgi:uncharacterized Tic20 family protein
MLKSYSPTQEERMLAALAHASVILFQFSGIGLILLWMFQRRKSAYVSFHALQALGYQIISYWVWMSVALLAPFIAIATIILEISLAAANGGMNENFMPIGSFLFPFSFMILFFGIFLLIFGVGMFGALMTFMGRDFRYPFLGGRLEKYLFVPEGDEAGAQ